MKRKVRDLALFAFFSGWLAPLLVCMGLMLNHLHEIRVIPVAPEDGNLLSDSPELLAARVLFRIVVLWTAIAAIGAVALLLLHR